MYAPNPFETMPIVLDAKAQEEQLIASLLDGDGNGYITHEELRASIEATMRANGM